MTIYGQERGKLIKKRNIALFLLMLCICLLAGCGNSNDAAAEYEALMSGETVCIPFYNNYSHTSQYLTIDAEEKTVTLRWSDGFSRQALARMTKDTVQNTPRFTQ